MMTMPQLMAQGGFDPRGRNPYAQVYAADEAARRQKEAAIAAAAMQSRSAAERNRTLLQKAMMDYEYGAGEGQAERDTRTALQKAMLDAQATEADKKRLHDASESLAERDTRTALQREMLGAQATAAEESRKHAEWQHTTPRAMTPLEQRELEDSMTPMQKAIMGLIGEGVSSGGMAVEDALPAIKNIFGNNLPQGLYDAFGITPPTSGDAAATGPAPLPDAVTGVRRNTRVAPKAATHLGITAAELDSMTAQEIAVEVQSREGTTRALGPAAKAVVAEYIRNKAAGAPQHFIPRAGAGTGIIRNILKGDSTFKFEEPPKQGFWDTLNNLDSRYLIGG
jgi:hypothetical protein